MQEKSILTDWGNMALPCDSGAVANAHHHRSDAYTSVVALVGIGGAQLGWAFCDPLAGIRLLFGVGHPHPLMGDVGRWVGG